MPAQPGAILVVDDNAINRAVFTAQLEAEGHVVTTAELGSKALALLRSQSFDVVLLDLMMPEMDGFQVLEQIKADNTLRHIPVIVVSALDDMEFVVRSIKMGAADHLPKPFDLFLLRARINASLAAKRLHDQEAEYLRNVAHLTKAAAQIEVGTFDPDSITAVAKRDDELGQLARVFQRMAHEVLSRERLLLRENQFKSALIGKITHELRSPFAAADFSVQLLQRYVEHNMIAELQGQIQQLGRQLAEGRQMIDHAIAFASFVGRQSELQLEATDLAQLIGDVVTPLRRLAKARGVTLSVDELGGLPRLQVARQQLGEAIHHLVLNAIRFNRKDGTVRVGCQAAVHDLVFTVEDSGQGIAPDKLEVIWEAFGQAVDDVERGVEGLGLGLALVRSVIVAHGGTVQAQSTLGQGSVFGFRIPIAG
jgi:signal transduction histidine kinase